MSAPDRIRFALAFAASLGAAATRGDALWIDVRSNAEFRDAHIDGDANLPHDRISQQIAALEPDTSREIVVYCGTGKRALRARSSLQQLGYTRVYSGGSITEVRKVRARPRRCWPWR